MLEFLNIKNTWSCSLGGKKFFIELDLVYAPIKKFLPKFSFCGGNKGLLPRALLFLNDLITM